MSYSRLYRSTKMIRLWLCSRWGLNRKRRYLQDTGNSDYRVLEWLQFQGPQVFNTVLNAVSI